MKKNLLRQELHAIVNDRPEDDAGQADARVDSLQHQMRNAEQSLQYTKPPPGVTPAKGTYNLSRLRPRARRNSDRLAGGGKDADVPHGRVVGPSRDARLMISTGNKAADMFNVDFWSSFAPLCFPYGDGVFGIERIRELSYDEWVTYLLQRELLAEKPSYHSSDL